MDILNNINEIGNKIENFNLEKIQKDFLNSKVGQLVNLAVEQGIKYAIPDFIEDDVIELKDTLISEGFGETVNKAVEKAVDLGKTAIGIITGNFENINQAQNAIKEGGLIDGISDIIDAFLKKMTDAKVISKDVSKLIKNGKKEILKNVEKNIKNEFINENKSLEKLEKSIEQWKNNYKNKDIDGINKEFKKIEKEEKNIMPLKNIINNINQIKNIHEIINNSQEFDFDNIYLELSNELQ